MEIAKMMELVFHVLMVIMGKNVKKNVLIIALNVIITLGLVLNVKLDIMDKIVKIHVLNIVLIINVIKMMELVIVKDILLLLICVMSVPMVFMEIHVILNVGIHVLNVIWRMVLVNPAIRVFFTLMGV
jgi:hypothetical protein